MSQTPPPENTRQALTPTGLLDDPNVDLTRICWTQLLRQADADDLQKEQGAAVPDSDSEERCSTNGGK